MLGKKTIKMKLSPSQLPLSELRSLKVGDRLTLHWQTSPNTIHHIEGVVSGVDWQIFRVKYFREGNPDWETAFFWNDFDNNGTSQGDYSWSFSKR